MRHYLCNAKLIVLCHSLSTQPTHHTTANGTAVLPLFEALVLHRSIMASSLIVATLALLPFAAAAPVQGGVHSESLEARQAPNCNIGTAINNAAYDSSCWNTLNIMPYLTNWKTTTPTCTDADNSAGNTEGCCVASEPWSTCFLRLATRKVNTYDCTQIATASCSFPASLDPALDPTIASQVNYIVLSIMMINNFFNSYYNGQLFSTCLKCPSSADYRFSSPKCDGSRSESPEFCALQ